MGHSWVTQGYCVAFMTDKGLMMDLDNMTFKKALWIAENVMKRYRLEGYTLIESSYHNYHVVFNRYLRLKTIIKILFRQIECYRWAIYQMQEGALSLRVGLKNNKDRPRIIKTVGKTDKLIKEYLEACEIAKNHEKERSL